MQHYSRNLPMRTVHSCRPVLFCFIVLVRVLSLNIADSSEAASVDIAGARHVT